MILRLIRLWRYKRRHRKQAELLQTLQQAYQVKEYHGELWFTYCGDPVIPCSMLNDLPIDALQKIRKLHLNFS